MQQSSPPFCVKVHLPLLANGLVPHHNHAMVPVSFPMPGLCVLFLYNGLLLPCNTKPRSLPCTCLQAFPIIMLLSSSFPLVFSHAVVPCSPSLQVTCINISYHNGCLSLALVFLSWRSSPCLPALQGVHYYVFHSLH